jgi:hypothetical protein
VSLYILESSALLATIAWHRKASRPLLAFLPTLPGVVSIVAALVLVLAVTAVVHRIRTWSHNAPRRFGFTVMLNLVPMLLLFASGELGVRLLSRPATRGLVFMGTPLLPWRWSDVVARNRAILKQASIDGTWVGSFLVPDDVLGWVIGPNRRSADGLSFSSLEGIRSPRPGVAFADGRARHRIAIVGDSFTFGLEVPYEDSWGHRLEGALGPDVQVLNFGVDGYGIDQAYLRYDRDIRPWRPDVVIFGLINHDFYRSLAVYSFVSFPEWGFPFAKPRFVATRDRLVLLNVPLLSPQAILAVPSIGDLPFVEYDPGYHEADWTWQTLDRSYLYRLIVSRYGHWSQTDARSSDEVVIGLNSQILHSFIHLAEAERSSSVIVYFPSIRDFRGLTQDPGWQSLAQLALRRGNIPHIDLTPCLAALEPAERFLVGRSHYSPRANAAVAACLRDEVQRHLVRIPPRALPGER